MALAGRRRGLRRRHRRPAPRAGAHPHRRALRGTAAPGAGRAARRPPHRGPAGAVPVLRRPDRGRRGALVRPRAGRRRRPRLRRSARPAPRGPDRRVSLPGRRPRPQHPARAGRRTGRTAGVRAAGRAHRAGPHRSAQPVGGRRRSRSRSPAGTVSPATWPPPRTASRCTSCRPATARHRGGTAGRRCATATSPPSTAGSTVRTGLRRPTWSRSSDAPDGAETAAAPVDAPDGARPGDDRRDRDAAAHAARLAARRGRGVAALPGTVPGAARAVGRDRLARAGERVPDGALRALARLRVRCAHADAPVPARALPPRRWVPVGVPPGGDAGARVAGGGRGPGSGRVPRPSSAGVLPARRAGRLVPAPARAGQLVRPGAAHRAGRCAAVGPGDRRRAQPPAEPLPVHRR